MPSVSLQYDLSEIGAAADWLIKQAAGVRVWLWHGDMGAGKTTLIKSVCTILGAGGDLSSPTYSLANEYSTSGGSKIYHLDLYRLRSLDEALDIGIEEYIHSGDLCLIEWPQLIMPLLREGEFVTIHIDTISASERKITIFI
jgi:tRNA threonylcarbamoyladenosine biosynthesis protein TsaE